MSLAGPVKAAILAAVVVGTASYLAEHTHPALAGIIASIPVALPAMWFLSDKTDTRNFYDYTWTFLLGILSYLIAVAAFYYLFVHRGVKRNTAIIYSMGIWLIMAATVYCVFANLTPH